ncbi:MAG: hypothetical protein ABH834_08270 [Candidatus Altiarchaeota archaeon]
MTRTRVSRVFTKGIESYEKILDGLDRPEEERLELKTRFNAMHLVKVRGTGSGVVVEGKYIPGPEERMDDVNARMQELWGGKLTFRLEAVDSVPEDEKHFETEQSLTNKKWLAELLSGAKKID